MQPWRISAGLTAALAGVAVTAQRNSIGCSILKDCCPASPW